MGGTDAANAGGVAKGFGPCGGVMVGVDGGQPLWGGKRSRGGCGCGCGWEEGLAQLAKGVNGGRNVNIKNNSNLNVSL